MLFEHSFFHSLLHLTSNEKKLFDEYCDNIIWKIQKNAASFWNLAFVCNMVIRFWISFLFDEQEHVHFWWLLLCVGMLCSHICIPFLNTKMKLSFRAEKQEIATQMKHFVQSKHRNILCCDNDKDFCKHIQLSVHFFFIFQQMLMAKQYTCTINSYTVFRFIWYPIWGFHYGRGQKNANK